VYNSTNGAGSNEGYFKGMGSRGFGNKETYGQDVL